MRYALRSIAIPLLATVCLAACSGDDEPPGTNAAGPGPCAGLVDPLELAVCEDPDLRAMDADLSRLYQRLLARADHARKADLRADHAEWRRALARCMERPPEHRPDCLDEKYNLRLVTVAGQLETM